MTGTVCDRGSAAATLEERLTRIAELVAANRAVNWELGDVAADLVREYGRGIVGKIAEVCGWKRSEVIQVIRLSCVFPPEVRYPDVRRSWYTAALQTANRMGLDPVDVLNEALEQGLSAAQIHRMGREAERAVFKAACACGIRIRVEGPGGCVGTQVLCYGCNTVLGTMRHG